MAELFIWDRVIKDFKEKNGSEVTSFIFSQSKFLSLDKNILTLLVDPMSFELLNDKNSFFYEDLLRITNKQLKTTIEFKFVTNEEELNSIPYISSIIEDSTNNIAFEYSHLNPSFTFDNYFYSYDNRTVIEASKKVIDDIINNNNSSFNPLFIHGSSGIGKTHIVNAIGNKLYDIKPNLKILYKNATEFFNEYTNLFKGNLNTSKLDKFKELYFNLDVFIIDDIQMLATKEGSLNEFFAIFENMRTNNKYTIITSDVPPKELNFEDRLLTRFLSGLVLEIQFPDTDTKTQIFKYHAHKIQLNIDESAIKIFINSSKNVRELLGYINLITVDLIANNLENQTYSDKNAIEIVNKTTGNYRNISKDDIINIVCTYFDIPPNQITFKSRKEVYVKARNFCVFFLKDKLKLTFKEISVLLGMKDHSNAVKIYNSFETYKEKNQKEYKSLSQKINNIK